ncbi:MAG: AAA family ATPase [Thermoproteota archaeon]
MRRGEAMLEPFTIILGGNNSDKTTILEALFLAPNPFRRVPYSGVDVAVKVLHEQHRVFESKGYFFLFHNYTSSEAKIQCDSHVISFLRDDETIYVTTNRSDAGQCVMFKGKPAQVLGKLPFSLTSIVFMYANDKVTREDSLLLSPSLARMSYDYLRINWPLLAHSNVCNKIAEELSRLTGEKCVDITMEPFFEGGVTLNLLLEEEKRIRLTDAGTGVQNYVTARILYELKKPGILLWDDVDNGLDPAKLSSIAGWFSSLVEKGTQVIATTRSPEAARRIAEAAGGRPTILLSILKEDTLKTRRLLQTELDNDELLEEKKSVTIVL